MYRLLILLAATLLVTAQSANGTISVLSATYGGNCNNRLEGGMTAEVSNWCNGNETCTYTICICGWDTCSADLPPCVADPATSCAKDFRVSWRCSADAPGYNRSLYIAAEADLSPAAISCGPPPPVFTPRNMTIVAFVYDPWTPEPVVFGEHGTSWTEWELVRRAEPRFDGHLQPKVPLWGELNTSLPATWDILNVAALSAGIEVYAWDWYWWADAPQNPLLVRGLELGFLHAPTSSRMRWYVMWANQDWVDIMPAKRHDASPTKFHGRTNASTFTELSDYWINNYFSLPNYMRVPDAAGAAVCPIVSIYELDVLIQGLGGLDGASAAFIDFRSRAFAAGHACVHIQVMGFGARSLPAPIGVSLQKLGVDSVTDYCPQHYQGMPGFPLVNYTAYSYDYRTRYGELAAQVAPVPYAPNFGVAWDPSPRTVQSDAYDNWGYPSTPVLQPTLAEFRAAVSATAEAVAARCTESWCWLTVYAYTEFSEGGSLWPTEVDGYGRLDAFTAVFGNRSSGTSSSAGEPKVAGT